MKTNHLLIGFAAVLLSAGPAIAEGPRLQARVGAFQKGPQYVASSKSAQPDKHKATKKTAREIADRARRSI